MCPQKAVFWPFFGHFFDFSCKIAPSALYLENIGGSFAIFGAKKSQNYHHCSILGVSKCGLIGLSGRPLGGGFFMGFVSCEGFFFGG